MLPRGLSCRYREGKRTKVKRRITVGRNVKDMRRNEMLTEGKGKAGMRESNAREE